MVGGWSPAARCDASTERGDALVSAPLEEDVRRWGLSAARIQEALVTIPALKRIVVFDTGQSGGKVGLARTARDPFAFRGAIERLSRSSGAFMIAAAAVSDN